MSWTNADSGSGVVDYDLYVSINGGPFAVWRQFDAATTSAVYQEGSAGNSYAFASAARDAAGNAEPTPTAAEATTAVVPAAITLRRAGDDVALIDTATSRVIRTRPLSDISALVIEGGPAAEILKLDFASGIFALQGGLTFHGGGGADRFEVTGSSAEAVTVTGPNLVVGTTAVTLTGVGSRQVSGVASLAFATAGGNDAFVFTQPAGESGKNRLAQGGVETTFFDVAKLEVNLGTNDAPTHVNSVTVPSGWVASKLKDVTITGGVGRDILIYPVPLTTLPVADGAFTFDGGAGVADMVSVSDNTNWTLSAAAVVSGRGGRISFTGVEEGRLKGGVGNNVLHAAGFGGRAILDGGNGVDTLVSAKGGGVLVGGAGNDKLIGGVGRDVMIGGTGADTLTGSGGEDLLIGGWTTQDAKSDSLALIFAEWSRLLPRTFPQRTQALSRFTPGSLNGSVVLNAATVKDDRTRDTLNGGLNLDWYWSGVADQLIGFTPNEKRS